MKTIVDIKVVDVEKRRQPSKHYVYKVFLTWSEGSTTVVYRRYSKFFEFQVRLLETFPEEAGSKDPTKRMIPFLPGKKIFGRSHVREVAVKRLDRIDEYCRTLVRLPPKISECQDLLEFFMVMPEDINPPTEEEYKRKKKKSKETQGESITEPILLEQYVAISDYKKQKKNEVDLAEGAIVDVVEKNENGWWFVNVDFEQGWVPASYLEPVDGSPEPDAERVTPGEEETFITTSPYTAEKDDEMTFEQGVTVEVIQKNLDGWWLVKYQKKEGWAPSAYLVKPKVLPDSSMVTGPVEIVGSAMEASSTSTVTRDAVSAKAEPPRKSISSPPKVKKVLGDVNVKPLILPTQTKKTSPQPKEKPTPRRGSIKIVRPKKVPGKAANLHDIAEAVRRASGAVTDKIFVSTAAFRSEDGAGLSFDAGVKVEKVEEAETGWWLVRIGDEEGWVPSTYFEPARSPPTPKKTPEKPAKSKPAAPPPPKRAPKKKKTKKVTTYITMADFESQVGDGISFSGGETIVVEEKAASGWWFIHIGEREGWAPSSYIEVKEEEVEVDDDCDEKPSKPVAAPAVTAIPSVTAGQKDGEKVMLTASTANKVKRPSPRVPRKSIGSELESGGGGGGGAVLRSSTTAAGLDEKKRPLPAPRKSMGAELDGKGGGDSNPLAAALAARAAKIAKEETMTASSEKVEAAKGGAPQLQKRTPVKEEKTPKASPPRPKRGPIKFPEKGGEKDQKVSPPRPKRGPMKLPERKPAAVSAPVAVSGGKPSPRVPRRVTAAAASIADKLSSVLEKNSSSQQLPRSKTTAASSSSKNDATVAEVVSIGDYDGAEGEVAFKVGEKGQLVEKNENGWWYVRFGSMEGWAPSTYLEEKKASSKAPPLRPSGSPAMKRKEEEKKTSSKAPPLRPSGSPATKRKKEKSAASSPLSKTEGKPKPSRSNPNGGGGDFVTTGSYSAAAEGEIGFSAGESANVLEKTDSGWWFIKIGTKEGWAPSTYLELSKVENGGKVGRPTPHRPARVQGNKGGGGYRALAAFKGDDGFGLEEGETLVVEEKADSGWWYVKTGGREGWAPSTYIEST